MSPTTSLEIERKYDVDEAVRVPDLAGTGPIQRAETQEPVELRATYLDTADHVLLGNRITLRRREGGADEGWHVKLPASAGARREVHSPLGADPDEALPAELRRVVESVLRGRPVHPVLTLATTRTVTRLVDADGAVLGEVADDEVTASDPAVSDPAPASTWREWEVELAPGVDRADGEALLDTVGETLVAAGARVSSSKSKLARGLSAVFAGVDVPAPVALEPVELELGSAAEFVYDAIAPLVGDLVTVDPLVRSGEADAVHRFRTTVRRIRSILTVYRGVLPDDEAAWLADALRTAGRAASVARDLEVRAELLEHYADAAPDGRLPHESLARMRAALRETSREAAIDLERALDDPAYFELLDRLEALPVTEPEGDRALDDSDEFIADSLALEAKRAHRRVRAATTAVSGAGGVRRETVHSARKAARRLRYALEAAKSAGVKGTKAARRTTHGLQDLLGDALDADALATWVEQSADAARRAGEDTFAYGVIVTLADADRRSALAGLRRAAKGL
ncbi:CYTH and CHAD domain-containing protein [Frondihabitans australicus]|uniref:CHAD domain-containing protein n=1 Tax=Frondihabitans australicus TaxID=386892 RepID=A0A495IHH9_9MICO|nr:CYTH and CHAD domain-containing protein [Frondihabitans australicus]RKR74546.1 CHAD domain-containing protein [Frondihabitans australicus]